MTDNSGQTKDLAEQRADVAEAPALPALHTDVPPAEVVDRLEKRAQKGKLPGFEREGAESCSVLVFAGLYDHRLRITPGSGGPIGLELRMLRRMPAIVIGVLVLATWPGLPLTDSMLRIYFDWYDAWPIQTWWWYLPMMALCIPVVWKQISAARREALVEATKILAEVSPIIEAR